MRRLFLCLALVGLLVPGIAHGQDEPQFAYLAYYRINFADLEEWNRQYWEYSVPILEDLQEEGVIQGFNQWEHSTGSEYNIRFAVRSSDWASLDTFWGEYLSRLGQAHPDADGRLIQAHRDEIWNIGEVHMSAGDATASYIYSATFQFNFGDLEEWNTAWTDTMGPIMAEAMEEGLLLGWVKLDHNTGGPHNSKILHFFEEWDHIDDFSSKFLGDLADSGEFDRVMRMFEAHDDVIWVPTTR